MIKLIETNFENLEKDRKLALVTQIELRQSNPEVRKGINNILKRYLDIIDNVILNGKKTGVFHEDLDVRIARRMVFGTLDETVTSWIMNGFKYSLLDQIDEIHRLFIHGMKK